MRRQLLASRLIFSSNNANLTVPASITVPGGSPGSKCQANAAAVKSNQTVVITGTANGVLQSSSVVLAAPAQLTSLSCTPVKIPSGTSGVCTVTLSQTAPTGGAVVALSGGNAVLSIPANVTLAPATTSATFAATASGAGQPDRVTHRLLERNDHDIPRHRSTAAAHTLDPG